MMVIVIMTKFITRYLLRRMRHGTAALLTEWRRVNRQLINIQAKKAVAERNRKRLKHKKHRMRLLKKNLRSDFRELKKVEKERRLLVVKGWEQREKEFAQ